jgi:lipopolysaccharide assembly protein A
MATQPVRSATNGHPRKAGSGPRPATRDRMTVGLPSEPRRTRAASTWFALCVAGIVLVALCVFMLQNTQPVLVSFLGMQGSVPLALALLIAGVGVGVIALTAGTIRIGQLRRRRAHSD